MVVFRYFSRARAEIRGGVFCSWITWFLCFFQRVRGSFFRRVIVVQVRLRVLQHTLRVRGGVECSRPNGRIRRLQIRFSNNGIVSSYRSMLLCARPNCVHARDIRKRRAAKVVTVSSFRSNARATRLFLKTSILNVKA